MPQDQLTQRVNELQQQLAAEFAAILPTDVVERCLRETADSYRSARIVDFVPLFVHRDARSRLQSLAKATSAVA